MTLWKLDLAYLIVGAIAGAYIRYKVGGEQIFFYGIPVTILFINVTGSFILGLSMASVQKFGLSQSYVILIGIGFCGSLTTMSSFALESTNLLEAGKIVAGFFDIILNVGLSLAAVLIGRFLIMFLTSII